MDKKYGFLVAAHLLVAFVFVLALAQTREAHVPKPGWHQPAEVVKNLIQRYIEVGGGGRQTVVFVPNTTIDVGAIARALGYSADQVCVNNEKLAKVFGEPPTKEEHLFRFSKRAILYIGKSEWEAAIGVHCDVGMCTGRNENECVVGVLLS